MPNQGNKTRDYFSGLQNNLVNAVIIVEANIH